MQRMHESLRVSAMELRPSLNDLVEAFRQRPGYVAKRPFDQVNALSYLLPYTTSRPCYYEHFSSADEAWDEVVHEVLDQSDRLDLLTCYPLARQLDRSLRHNDMSRKSWWPTWSQLMSLPHEFTPQPSFEYAPGEMLRGATEPGQQKGSPELRGAAWDCHSAYVVRGCRIVGVSGSEHCLVVDSGTASRETFGFRLFADAADETGDFTLVGVAELECWVVCRAGPERTLVCGDGKRVEDVLEVEKVAVGRMLSPRDRERLRESTLGCMRAVCYWNRCTEDEE